MKQITLIGLLLIGFYTKGYGGDLLTDIIRFASIDKAKQLLTQEDDFTACWSQFDIDSRLQKKNSTKDELLKHISSQVRGWAPKEKAKILSMLKSIDKSIAKQGFNIDFPDEIYFVKTTAKEEGGAGGYTRANYVVLKEGILSLSKGDLKKLIVHELFHVLSRNNPNLRKALYKIIGFEIIKEIEYPENLKNYRITNPDATQTDSYITLVYNGQQVDCMMILYASQDYDGGDFFKYLNIGFLNLKGTENKEVDYVDGQAVIYTFKEVSNFYEQVGRNTGYIIHPEEILADNFTFAILKKKGLPNQEIVDEIKKKLRE